MEIAKPAKAGTLESSDILVMVAPNLNGGIELELESVVLKQFGDEIRHTIFHKLQELDVQNIKIKAQDKGALDYTIRARVETAVKRAQ